MLAPSPSTSLAQLWRELVAPAVQEAAHQFVLGPADFGWPAPLVRLEGDSADVLAALARVPVAPPTDAVRVASLHHQLSQARVNLQLIEERESEYVLGTDVPLGLVKEKRRLQQRIAELEAELARIGPITL